MGQLHDHRVQNREAKRPEAKKPLIEEIHSFSSEFKKIESEKKDTKTMKADSPEYVLLRKPKDGKAEELIGYFKLPGRVRNFCHRATEKILRNTIFSCKN